MLSGILVDMGFDEHEFIDGYGEYWVDMFFPEEAAGIEGPLTFRIYLLPGIHSLIVGNGIGTGFLPCGGDEKPITLVYQNETRDDSEIFPRLRLGTQYVFALWLNKTCLEGFPCEYDNTWVPGYLAGLNPPGELPAEVHWWYDITRNLL